MSDDLVELSEPMTLMRTKDVRHLLDRIEKLEAELAKAVGALQQLVIEYDEVDLAYDEPKSMTAAYGVALDTLAELTGGKDE